MIFLLGWCFFVLTYQKLMFTVVRNIFRYTEKSVQVRASQMPMGERNVDDCKPYE